MRGDPMKIFANAGDKDTGCGNLDWPARIGYAANCTFDSIVFSVQTLPRGRPLQPSGSEMHNTPRTFLTAVQKYCAEHGIAVETRAQGWLMVMQKGPKRHLAYGYDLGLNNAVTHRIANDKAATAELLGMNGLACVPHAFFPSPALSDYVS